MFWQVLLIAEDDPVIDGRRLKKSCRAYRAEQE